VSDARIPRVVIVGGGFAGLYAAKTLRHEQIELTVLDRNNHNTFMPLLYQVAMAVLAPSEIASPIRWLLKKQKNTRVLLADVERIDVAKRVVIADGGKVEVPYDYLIVATGTRHAYFGHPEWEALAPGLKSIDDAREIRRRFLFAYESAEKAATEQERDELMTFVIVGGGPTGVELAGVLPEVGKRGIAGEFRRADTTRTRTILLEGGPRILPAFSEELSTEARRELTELGVEVRTGALVTRITPEAVYIGDERIPCRTVFWAAGNQASPLGKFLGAPLDRAGRVLVSPDLSVPGHPEIFVTGDLAVLEQDGTLVPGVAPAAIQEGTCAGKNIKRLVRGKPTVPFRYWDKGNLATIGRHRAVAQFGDFGVTGFAAWFLWLFIHILYLAGFRNRLIVAIEWGYSYFTYQRGARVLSEEQRRG
jgi:NADH dehydrogenase